MSDVSDKIVLITGASKGIGRAIAIEIAKNGAQVAINYNSDKKGAITTREAVKKYTEKTILIKADVSDQKQVEDMFGKLKKELGSIDILINNAGVALWKPFLEVSETEWDKTIDINLKGLLLC